MERAIPKRNIRETGKRAGKTALVLLLPFLLSAACVEEPGIVIQPATPTPAVTPKTENPYQQLSESTNSLDYQRAYENFKKTQTWMMQSSDPEVSSVPSLISPYVWSSDEKSQTKYAQTKIVTINENGETAPRVVLNMRNFDKPMSGQEIVDAAIELAQANQLFFLVNMNKGRIKQDPVYLLRLQEISQRYLPPSLRHRA